MYRTIPTMLYNVKNPWTSVLIILDLIMIIESVIDKHGDDLRVY